MLKVDITKTNKGKEEISNYSFTNGVNYIDNDTLFNLLFNGENKDNNIIKFVLNFDDDFISLPFNEDENKIWINYKINSKNIALKAFFLTTKDELNSFKDNIYNTLIKLKKLPLDKEEDNVNKINQILINLKQLDAKYVSVDLSNVVNKKNINIIKKTIANFDNISYPVLIFNDFVKQDNGVTSDEDVILIDDKSDEEQIENNNDNYYFIVVGENENEDKENQKPSKKQFVKNLFISIKKNWSSILLIMFSTFLMVLFSSLIVYSFKYNELLDSILILIISIVFFGISGFIYSSCFDFLINTKQKGHKNRIMTILIIIELSLLLSALIAYLILLLFYATGFLIDKETFNFLDIYPSFIFLVVTMLLPVVAKPINILFNKISKMFKKK